MATPKVTTAKTTSKPAAARKATAAKSTAAKKTTATKKPAVAGKSTVAKKPAASKKTAKSIGAGPEERYRMIEVAAYFLAERNGFAGSPVDYWTAAEIQINKLLGK